MPEATGSANPDEPAPEADRPPDFAEPIPPLPAGGPITVQIGPQGHITITVQPSTALVAPGVALADVTEKGLFGGGREEGGGQPGPFQQVLDKLKSALDTLGGKIVEFTSELTTLEVRTYVSDRIEDVRPDGANGFQNAHQRALTYVQFDGDTQVVVPVDAGQIDEALWKIHLQTVEQAQAHRQAMLRTVGELVAGFIPTLK
jgi:hypothetical protein